jgi:subtilase family serine protease
VQLAAEPQDGVHIASGALPGVRLSSVFSWYYADDLNEAYDFPSFQTTAVTSHTGPPSNRAPQQIAGVGSHIGIVISSVIFPADLQHSFNSTVSAGPAVDVQNYSGNSNLPVPTVIIRPVGNGSGPFNPNSGDALEASLDTQMSLGTAPGAQETLYDMEDLTDSSIAAAYTAVDEDNTVDVVSSSFGECELDFTPAYNGGVDYTGILQVFHSLFAQGNAQGITFVASSGDNGAVPCLSAAFENNPTNGTSYVPGVENQASDPAVTAVGGTNLVTVASPGPNDAKYSFENADFDPRVPAEFRVGPSTIVSVNNNTWGSGGGYSSVFAKPSYQQFVNTGNQHSRAVPDVSLMMGGCPGDADLNALDCTAVPRSATIIFFANGVDLVIGTSSSAPELAGVLALAVELNGGRLGNVNPLIYKLSAQQTRGVGAKDPNGVQYFHRNISGNNNFYTVSPGQEYSPVLGNSTLDVKNFLQLEGAASAGTPSTPSNP